MGLTSIQLSHRDRVGEVGCTESPPASGSSRVEFWRACGWADVCAPLGAEDFECR